MLTYKDSGVQAEKEMGTYQPKTVVPPSRVHLTSKVDKGVFTHTKCHQRQRQQQRCHEGMAPTYILSDSTMTTALTGGNFTSQGMQKLVRPYARCKQALK